MLQQDELQIVNPTLPQFLKLAGAASGANGLLATLILDFVGRVRTSEGKHQI